MPFSEFHLRASLDVVSGPKLDSYLGEYAGPLVCYGRKCSVSFGTFM